MTAENPTVHIPEVLSDIVLIYYGTVSRLTRCLADERASTAYLGSGEDVQGLDKGVVQNEHDGSRPPDPLAIPEEHLSKITNITDLRMPKAELPGDQAGVKNNARNGNSADEPRYQAEHRVGVRKGHYGKADVLAEEQCRSLPRSLVGAWVGWDGQPVEMRGGGDPTARTYLLPGARTVLDGVACFEFHLLSDRHHGGAATSG